MIIKEITKSEFEERFPEVSTYSFLCIVAYLENGVLLLESQWNGEEYLSEGKRYKPVYGGKTIFHWRLIGYLERV